MTFDFSACFGSHLSVEGNFSVCSNSCMAALACTESLYAWHTMQCACRSPFFAHSLCQLEVGTVLFVLCLSVIVLLGVILK
jgi:hypothetical protein